MMERLQSGSGAGRSLAGVIAGLMLAMLLMQISGFDSSRATMALAAGATGIQTGKVQSKNDVAIGAYPGTAHLNLYMLGQSLARMTPLLLCGLAIALGLRAGLFNIGAQGQMLAGALAAAAVGSWGLTLAAKGPPQPTFSPWLHIPLTLLAGTAAGALAGALPGLLKAVRGVHEVLTTIMLNYVIADMTSYLVTHTLKDPKSMATQTAQIAKSAWLPSLIPGSSLTFGLFLALSAAVLLTFLIRRTALGFEIRAVGEGMEAARAAGISTVRTLTVTMALSGALAGLAGAIEVMGVHHRYVEGVAGSYGFDGISVALLGGLGGGGVTLSALFFGALANGAAYMQVQTKVPSSLAVIVQAVVILFVALRYLPGAAKRRVSEPERNA